MAAMLFLLLALRTGRLGARTLTAASVFYLLFALCLVPMLT
jgi:hypothetical protein